MAKTKTNVYKLRPPQDPFIVEGNNGTYEIPHPEALDISLIESFADFPMEATLKEKAEVWREFFIKTCPDLEAEELSDYNWLKLGEAYDNYTGE